jgi:16S rRNA (guanine(966)-N(2))-methyltransferase RsmD
MNTRPTADRVKESLFSILSSLCRLEGLRILDLCAGTGSLGIEALSRGAAFCCFVEHDRPVMALLEKNLMSSGVSDRAELVTLDAPKGLQQLSRQGKRFDLVFLDPPYQSNLYAILFEALFTFPVLSDDALLVAECSSRVPLADSFGTLVKFDRRVYGDTALEFFAGEYR